jgi:hypothetical protein
MLLKFVNRGGGEEEMDRHVEDHLREGGHRGQDGGPGGEGREPEINLSRVPTFSRRENIQEEINVDTTLDSPRKGFTHGCQYFHQDEHELYEVQ